MIDFIFLKKHSFGYFKSLNIKIEIIDEKNLYIKQLIIRKN